MGRPARSLADDGFVAFSQDETRPASFVPLSVEQAPQAWEPLAGGAVHSHPEQEEQMHRDYDRRAYATLPELQKYEALTSKMNSTALGGLRGS